MRIRQFIALILWLAVSLPAGFSHAATATYTYDELNRVIKEEYQNGRVIEYTYDAVGNRLTSYSHMKSFQITLDTTPTGLQITADGVNYTAPHTFTWESQSPHTLDVPSPQSGGTGAQYLFSSWSDSGAQSHTITAPAFDSTFTATLQHQNLLTLALSPAGGGTITPAPAGTATSCADYLCEWYDDGATVALAASANSGYLFWAWSGDCTGSGACQVTLDAPRSVTATFLPILTQDRLPTSKINFSSPWSPTGCSNSNAYQCVDDPIGNPNNNTDYIRDNNSSGREATFGFSVFTVPVGSAITSVRVTYVAVVNSGSTATIQAALKVGGTGGQNTYTATAQTLSTSWTTYSADWTTNPRTGSAWTVDDVNGAVGAGNNSLKGMGVVSGSGDEKVTQVYVTVAYVVPPDTTAPANTTGANFINGGATATASTAVTLAIAGTDDVGVTGYYASESATAPTAGDPGWVAVTSTTAYSATVNFTLSTGEATKTVYVWLKDAAGNISTAASDTIILDTTAPANTTGADFINGGAASTTTTAVTLAIAATDSVGVTGYDASESATTPGAGDPGWVAVTSTTSYAATVNFTLSTGNGTKTVYVWFKDAAGNVSATGVSDTITLNVTGPTTQDRLPTNTIQKDNAWGTTGCSSSVSYQCVDDPIGSYDTTTYIARSGGSGQYAIFGFSSFTVPAGVTIDYVRATYVAQKSGSGSPSLNAVLKVGGTSYLSSSQSLTSSWVTYTQDWLVNPQTNAAWTINDVNGTGPYPLQGMGVYSTNNTPVVTQIYVTVAYH